MARARERSRSPRLDAHHTSSAFPLADFLHERGILDERSVEFLKKTPRKAAEDVLLSLSPEVRNPSAFVTRKLAPKLAGQTGDVPAPDGYQAPQHGYQAPPQQNGGANPALQAWAAQFPQPVGDVLLVHCNGRSRPLAWRSQGEAVTELLAWGVLDEGSADFLLKAPERDAKEIVASLGPDVRNPSAFVTRKLKELRHDFARQEVGTGHRAEPAPQAACEHVLIHHNGALVQLPWVSKEQAVECLMRWGVLDEGSSDFLLKASEQEAKQIISSLGPDVRNPSAYVTRKLKELMRDAHVNTEMMPPAAPVDTVPFHHNGSLLTLQWYSKEQAVGDLVRSGVLDEGSADFLMKAPEHEAKDIIASLGPDVRNPSAFVTRKMKELRHTGVPWEHSGPQSSTQTLVIHHNGVPVTLEWFSAEQAIQQLASLGVLDEGSAEFLGKVNEEAAKEIVSALGPEVRNPSAFVTRKVKAALHSDAPLRFAEQLGAPAGGTPRGSHTAAATEEPQMLTVYHNGTRLALTWHFQQQALEELVARGVLDQRSADFLAKLPERTARDIVASLGPDVRNPSAFVTKEARKWQA